MHRILLTGATGFLGKMVLFKLLQRDDVERVYLFMRPKGDQTVEERFEQSIIGNSMFEPFASRLRTVCRPIEATQELPLCGVSESNLLLLRSSVTGVINCVASIRFNLAINRAYVSNVKTLQNLLELAKQLPLMEHFVHTSTAYVFARKDRFDQLITCPNGFDVDQDAYFSGITEQSISEDLLAQSHYPNSYTFTKSLAEYVIRQEELPFAFSVVRPSIITSSHLAPYPGWVESEAGYLAYVKSIIDGGVPMLYLNRHNRLNLVPVDHVADILSAVVTEHRADVSPRTYYATASIQHTPSLIETLYVFRHIFRTISKKEIRHLPLYLPFGWMFSFLLWLRDKLPRKLQAKRLTWQGKKTDARRLQRMGSINEQLYAQYRHFLNQPFHFHDNLAYEFGETHRADLYHSIVIRKSLKKAGLRHDGYEVFAGNDMITRHGDLFFALSTKGWNIAKRVLGLWFLRLSRHVFTKVEINMENLLTALATMPKGATVVFAPTHKSYFDFLLLYFLCFAFPELKIYGLHTAAAEKLSKVPVFARVMRALDVFFVDRDPNRDTIRDLRHQTTGLIGSSKPFMFFPEGKRSRSGRLMPVKRGMFRYLKEVPNNQGFHIIPMAFKYQIRPDELSLTDEFTSGKTSKIRFLDGVQWYFKALIGKVQCGNVAINVGAPLALDKDTNLHDFEPQLTAIYRTLEDELAERVTTPVRLSDQRHERSKDSNNSRAIA